MLPEQAGNIQHTGYWLQPASSHSCQGRWLHTQTSSFPLRDGHVSFCSSQGKGIAGHREGEQICVGVGEWFPPRNMLLANSTAQDCHHEVWSHRSKVSDKRKGQPCTQNIQPVGSIFFSALGSICQDEMHQERYHFAKS